MNTGSDKQPWAGVLQFWFPEGSSFQIDADVHRIIGRGGFKLAQTTKSSRRLFTRHVIDDCFEMVG